MFSPNVDGANVAAAPSSRELDGNRAKGSPLPGPPPRQIVLPGRSVSTSSAALRSAEEGASKLSLEESAAGDDKGDENDDGNDEAPAPPTTTTTTTNTKAPPRPAPVQTDFYMPLEALQGETPSGVDPAKKEQVKYSLLGKKYCFVVSFPFFFPSSISFLILTSF